MIKCSWRFLILLPKTGCTGSIQSILIPNPKTSWTGSIQSIQSLTETPSITRDSQRKEQRYANCQNRFFQRYPNPHSLSRFPNPPIDSNEYDAYGLACCRGVKTPFHIPCTRIESEEHAWLHALLNLYGLRSWARGSEDIY
jgi:hypothetical protein